MSTGQAEKKELETELERYKECDPEVIEEMKKETKMAKEAANRWTGKLYRFMAKNNFVLQLMLMVHFV